MIDKDNGACPLHFSVLPDPNADPGSLFHFPQHWQLGHFRTFSRISHTALGRFSSSLLKDWPATQGVRFWCWSGSGCGSRNTFPCFATAARMFVAPLGHSLICSDITCWYCLSVPYRCLCSWCIGVFVCRLHVFKHTQISLIFSYRGGLW